MPVSVPAPPPAPHAAVARMARACAGANEREDPLRLAHAVRCAVNAVRAAQGLRRLGASGPLARAASSHARDMARRGYFGHTSPTGSTPTRRARRAGYPSPWIGETIAFAGGSTLTAGEFVAQWLASPAHRAILLDAEMRRIGVGSAEGSPFPREARGRLVVVDVGRR